MKDQLLFQKLAVLLDYPGSDYFEQVKETESLIDQSYSMHYLSWIVFSRRIESLNLGDLQERYISSFDVKTDSSLDVGHILFGEDKKRNGFLIHLREEHDKVEHNCGKEMPDYLPNLLQLIALSEDLEFLEELTVSIILPALRLMNSRLKPDSTLYSGLFLLLIEIIEKLYAGTDFQEYVPVGKTSCNFSKNHCNHG